MSEPSKEAKEAADAAWKELSGKSIFGAYALGYDAATAKLRAELDEQINGNKRLADLAAKLREDINRLNQMLRDKGYGQGEIDAYVAQCEEIDKLKAQWHEEHEEMADYIAKLRTQLAAAKEEIARLSRGDTGMLEW